MRRTTFPQVNLSAGPVIQEKATPEESQQIIDALARGQVDALVISGEVFMLNEARRAQEKEHLVERLRESDETLRAIQNGEVDALMIGGRVYTLKGAEQPYRVFVEEMQEGALTVVDGTVLFSNRRMADLLKIPLEQLVSKSIRDVVAVGDWLAFEQLMNEGYEKGSRGEIRLVSSDGVQLPVQVSISRLTIEGLDGHCVIVTDLTQQKLFDQLQAALVEMGKANDRTTGILSTIMDCHVVLDEQWRYVECNERAAEVMKVKESDIIGRVVWDLFPNDVGSRFHYKCQEAVRERRIVHLEMTSTTDGRWYEVVLYPFEGGLHIYSRDITDRKHAEIIVQMANDDLERKVEDRTKELRRLNAELQREIDIRKATQRQVLVVGEEEQRRLGRDLHDGPQQSLTAILFKAELLRRSLAERSVVDTPELDQIAGMVDRVMAELRAISRSVYPITLEKEGFAAAMHELVTNTAKLFNIHCELSIGTDTEWLNKDEANHLYRIAQETITNAIKHAKATEIDVIIGREEGDFHVAIIDNSVGFEPQPQSATGMGLSNIFYRAELIGASMEYRHLPDGRFSVVCTMGK